MPESSDHDQFVRLWVQNQMQVHAYLHSLVGNLAATEDILQEVAMVAWRKFDQFTPGTRFEHWVCRIALNKALHYRRQHCRDLLMFDEDLISQIAEEAAQEAARPSEYLEALESCMKKLPDEDQSLVRKRLEAGATNRSVARELNLSESTISRTLNRIYLALMECVRRTLGVGMA